MTANRLGAMAPVKFSTRDAVAIAENEMIFVLEGDVGVYKDNDCIGVIKPKCFYGENNLFSTEVKRERFVALTEAYVFIINHENIKDFFSRYADTAIAMFEMLCKRQTSLGYTPELEPPAIEETETETTVAVAAVAPNITATTSAVVTTVLFPEGHGTYTLEMSNENKGIVYCAKTTCPLCDHEFESLGVLYSRLRIKSTDPDSRVHYMNVEPLYYDIITCPNCLFSCDFHTFNETKKELADKVGKKVSAYKGQIQFKPGIARDAYDVFVGYYLALLCSPAIFPDHQINCGGLWHKISRIYADCGDKKMEIFAEKKSFDNYLYAYTKIHTTDSQSQQIAYMLGELCFKLGKLDEAKNYFHKVKTDPVVTPILKRRSENRIEEVREFIKQKEVSIAEDTHEKHHGKKWIGNLFKK